MLPEHHEGVDHVRLVARPRDARALHLGAQHREVEGSHVVAHEVGADEVRADLRGDLLEGLLRRDVGVGDPVHRGRLGRDGDTRVHAAREHHHGAAGARLDQGDLDDPRGRRVGAGGLEVEGDEGAGHRAPPIAL